MKTADLMEEMHPWKLSEEEERWGRPLLTDNSGLRGPGELAMVGGGKKRNGEEVLGASTVHLCPPACSQYGRLQDSEKATAEEAGLLLRLRDLDSVTAALRRVALLQQNRS